MPQSDRLWRCIFRVMPAHRLFHFVINILRQGFCGCALENHESKWPMDRYQRRRPTPVAECPDADPVRIDVRVTPHYVIDNFHVISSLARSIEEPVTNRLAHTALVVANDVDSVAHEERDNEPHLSRFRVVAMD